MAYPYQTYSSAPLVFSPPTPPTIIDTLASFWNKKQYTDVNFCVGPNQVKIPAHKTILMMRSPIFATMLTKRWEDSKELKYNAENGELDIHLPMWDPAAFNVFLKFLYTDKLDLTDKPLNVDLALGVYQLSSMYQCSRLSFDCSNIIKSNIKVDNCIPLYQGLRVFSELEATKNAFQKLKTSLPEICGNIELLSHIEENTWMELLNEKRLDIEELELFKALQRWSSKTAEKGLEKEQLQKFVPVMKFESMDAAVFAKEILPTGVLSDAEALRWFVYYSEMDGTTDNTDKDLSRVDPVIAHAVREPRDYSTINPQPQHCRYKKLAFDTNSLKKLLVGALPGDIISLAGVDYVGNFSLLANGVTIMGARNGHSVIYGRLDIAGMNCKVINVRLKKDTDFVYSEPDPCISDMEDSD